MAIADDGRDELSVRLDWPADLLGDTPSTRAAAPAENALTARFEAVEHATAGPVADDDANTAVAELAERLDQLGVELAETLRTMHDTVQKLVSDNLAAMDERIAGLRTAIMAMLSSKHTEEQRSQRRDHDALEAIAGELESLRKRIQMNAKGAAGLDDATMENLATRIADEVEIRVVSAIKPKPKPRRTG